MSDYSPEYIARCREWGAVGGKKRAAKLSRAKRRSIAQAAGRASGAARKKKR